MRMDEKEKLLADLKKMNEELKPMMEKLKENHEKMLQTDIMQMTKEELVNLENFEPTGYFNGIVIVPMEENHDSDFSCMKFILLNSYDIVGVVSGWSDVIHLNGIGGYGEHLKEMNEPKIHPWRIDCLPISKCVRLFTNENLKIDDFIGSDFIVYTCEDEINE